MFLWPFSPKENGTATMFPRHSNRRNALALGCRVDVLELLWKQRGE